jgi:hypothetical protein
MRINFASTRLAFFLIALLAAHMLLSAVIPQQGIAEEQIVDWRRVLGDGYAVIELLALDRIYYAPPFFVLLGLLALNLIAGNIKRFRLIYKTEKTLFKARYIGSVVFHLSLVVILAGVILNYLFKFDGAFALTEGQTATDNLKSYFRVFQGPLSADDFGRFTIRLDSISTRYQVGDAVTNAAGIAVWSLSQQQPDTALVFTNHPFFWQGLEFHYGLVAGFSPEVLLTDSLGEKLFGAFVRLAARKINGQTRHADFIMVPELGMKVDMELTEKEDQPDSIRVSITSVRTEDTLFSGRVGIGQKVMFDGYQLTIPRWRRWCYINVVDSPFLSVVFFGFWTALGGLVIGFLPRLAKSRSATDDLA